MRIKKILAVLLSAALALTLFAGCGSKSLLQILLGMLQGQYQNVSVTAGPELEDALRQAVSENDTLEDINAALEQVLTSTASFDSLWNADAGDHAFDLVYKTGADTQAIARQTYTEWNRVLGALPAAGRYAADLAIVQADGGWYILLDVSVLGGTNDSGNGGSSGQNGAFNLAGIIKDGNETVILESGRTYVATWRLTEDLDAVFNGTLKSSNPDIPAIIRIDTYASLFDTIGPSGRIENIHFIVEPDTGLSLGKDAMIGAVAGSNQGTITGCTLTYNAGKTIGMSRAAGSYVGENAGLIENCEAVLSGSSTKIKSTGSSAGGIAGHNTTEGKIRGCTVTVGSGASIEGYAQAGGIVGRNEGEVASCTVTMSGGTIKAETYTNPLSTGYAGGIAGENYGAKASITNCTVKGTGTITSKKDGALTPQNAGGIFGINTVYDNNNNTGTVENNTFEAGITISGQ